MSTILSGTPVERTIWVFVVFVAYLYWNEVEISQAIWLPLGGLVAAWVTGTFLAIPFAIAPGYDSYSHAWTSITPWLVLVIVPIYVWRRVPGVLIPRVKLSELILWNVLVIALSFGTAAARLSVEPRSWDSLGLRFAIAAVGLWPTALAFVTKRTHGYRWASLLKAPLLAYFWISLVWWLGRALLDPNDPSSWPLLGLLTRLWESFAAIQLFAILYLLYYALWGHEDLDFETAARVGGAVQDALEIDEWRPGEAFALASVVGAGAVAFAWWNQASGWEIPLYALLALPYTLAQALASTREPLLPAAR
jgi:hypothetical protein